MNVNEDESVDTVVTTLSAPDTDSTDTAHGVVTYSILSGADPLFELEASTGKIRLVGE